MSGSPLFTPGSISCGEGVGVRVHVAHTWVATLAQALGAEVDLLSANGLACHGAPCLVRIAGRERRREPGGRTGGARGAVPPVGFEPTLKPF